MSKKGKKGKIGKILSKKSETHGNKSKICKEGQDCKTTIFEDLKQGGVVIWVRKVRKVRLEKKLSKKLETHGNKSKICKEGRDCMTTSFEDQTRWGGNMSKKCKKGKIRKKNHSKNWRPLVIRVSFVRKDKTIRQQFLKISNKVGW